MRLFYFNKTKCKDTTKQIFYFQRKKKSVFPSKPLKKITVNTLFYFHTNISWRLKTVNYPFDIQAFSLVVRKCFNDSALTPEVVMQGAAMETRTENANFVSNGRKVAKRVR